jgi:hypothetical protein
MIRYTAKTDTRQLDDMIKYMDRIDREIDAIGKYALSEIRDELLDDLTDEPPRRNYPSDYPLEWTSEKQRKAYFATDGFGAGIPFKRSGKMSQSWQITGVKSGKGFAIVVSNKSKGAKYVGGTLAQDVRQAIKPVQKFHQITGWEAFSPKVQYWLGVANRIMADQWQRRFAKSAGLQVSGSAYTTPSKRKK